MSYNLSVVNIVPDTHRDSINQIAELYGCGPNNMSVKLVDANGAVYWGCHSWWNPDDYATFSDEQLRSQIITADILPSLEFLYERIVLDGDAHTNWDAALNELGLRVAEE